MRLAWLDYFHPRHQPAMTRQSYSHELVTAMTYPAALALIEGGVIGILASKAFNVSPMQFATIMAAPNFANLTSFVWARLARGKPKVRFINQLQIATLLCVGLIAVLPEDRLGAWVLTLLLVLARCLLAGMVTLRSTVWRQNYPRLWRAQVTGRLTIIQSVLLTITPALGYAVLDVNVQAFRIIYPLSVVLGLVGTAAFARVRLRGERDLLRYEMRDTSRPQPHGEVSPIYEYDPHAQRVSFWSVLRQDRSYRRYMIAQFIGGSSNMMGETVLIYVIAEMTLNMPREYLLSILLTTAMPIAISIMVMPRWAKFMDRVHITRFRAQQSWMWTANQAFNWIGAITGSLAVLAFSRVLQGLVRSGGNLAWNLGHNDFADRRLVATYMGIHVTLTGVRGAIFPFLGMALYSGWETRQLLGAVTIPGYAGMGGHLFLISTIMAAISWVGYSALARDIGGGGVRADS
jgi:hypothetical protein